MNLSPDFYDVDITTKGAFYRCPFGFYYVKQLKDTEFVQVEYDHVLAAGIVGKCKPEEADRLVMQHYKETKARYIR